MCTVGSTPDRTPRPGLVVHRAKFQSTVLKQSDLSESEWRNVRTIDSDFERCTLEGCQVEALRADRCHFAFADLRRATLLRSDFTGCSLVGVRMSPAEAAGTRFRETDFFWAEMDGFHSRDSEFEDARRPRPTEIKFAPRSEAIPQVRELGLHRAPANAERRRAELAASLDGAS